MSMKSIASLALALLGLSTAAPAAHASSYFLFGIGPKAGVNGDLDNNVDGDTHALRFGLGQRIGPIALEGSVFGADLVGTGGNTFTVDREFSTVSAGVDLKGFASIVGPLEIFGKAGLNQTWIMENDMDGAGWELGAGGQFVLDVEFGYAAIWADFTHQSMGLSDGNRDVDGGLNMVMVGASLGL
jgi:hypothetical protein